MKRMIEMTEGDFQEMNDENIGVCLACGEFNDGGTEPDAEGYHCDCCEADAVCGLEQALVLGRIVII
jgi:hypothetical protein